jgi:hypothetical protein
MLPDAGATPVRTAKSPKNMPKTPPNCRKALDGSGEACEKFRIIAAGNGAM